MTGLYSNFLEITIVSGEATAIGLIKYHSGISMPNFKLFEPLYILQCLKRLGQGEYVRIDE